MHPHRPHPLKRRRDRGLTLLELGIVMAVAVVLMVGVAASLQGLTRHARASRTVDEMTRLLETGQNLVARTLTIDLTGATPKYNLEGHALPDPSASPLILDLSTLPSTHYLYKPLSQLIGVPVTPENPVGLANAGKNPYSPAQPYKLHFNSARVEVQTCVDGLDYLDYAAFKTLTACNMAGCNPPDWQCVSISGPLVNASGQRTRFSYDTSLFMP